MTLDGIANYKNDERYEHFGNGITYDEEYTNTRTSTTTSTSTKMGTTARMKMNTNRDEKTGRRKSRKVVMGGNQSVLGQQQNQQQEQEQEQQQQQRQYRLQQPPQLSTQ